MKKLSEILIKEIIESTDRRTAVYLLQGLIQNHWHTLNDDERQMLLDLMDSAATTKKD